MTDQKTYRQKSGSKGEKYAFKFLTDKGYQIMETNYRFRKSEIDLIAKENDCLVFLEIKTRKEIQYGYPESFVTKNQIRKIQSGAQHYIESTNWQGNIRFDVIAIVMAPDKEIEIKHFEDTFP